MKWLLAALFFLVLVGGLSACHERQAQQQEQQQISPAVRAAVAAALGPHVSDADATEFLRSAKLASRTKHDTEVVAMLDEVVNLARSAAQDDYQAEGYHRESRKLSSMSPEEKKDCSDSPIVAGDSEAWVSACKEFNEAGQRLDKIHHDKARHSEEVAQNYENESKRKKEQITDLVQKLQAAAKLSAEFDAER
ncbi:MAG: hypothetical protein HY233_07245 [Acidobacteriales bacterium]|nr:hypothetical protein [Terriglobales bacterium]